MRSAPARGSRPPLPSIEARLRERYPELPKSERQIADVILEFPGDIAAYSATELADIAKSSKAAVTRLIRRLGYRTFEEARRQSRDAREWGSPLYHLQHESGPPASKDSPLKAHLERDFAIMAKTFEGLSAEELDEIVTAIAGARKVGLLGYRNSYFLASYARLLFRQVRENVSLMPLGGETLAEYFAGLGKEDLLVVIGFRRRVPQLRSAMETAKRRGVPILYITDPTVRETAGLARWSLLVHVEGGVFDSYTAALSLIHYLSLALLEKTGKAGRRRLKQIEALHDDLFDFG